MKAPVIAPSLLSADLGRLVEEVCAVDAAGADWIHVDIMDGRYVPNITFGPMVIRAIRKATNKPFDVHLMVVEPERHLDEFVNAGANHLLVEAQPAATSHLHRTLSYIRQLRAKAGVVLDPATPASMIEHVLHLVEVVLVMTVNPGFGGQRFLAEMLPKVRAVREMCSARGLTPWIEVDGGLTPETIGPARKAGADAFVAGSAVFGSRDYGAAIAALRSGANAI